MKETELYAPVKALFEGQGYEVKSEVGAADVVAVREDEPPVIVELKTSFSLALFHQGIARQTMSENVYIAVPRQPGKRWQKSLKDNLKLCRLLGLGLITVRLKDGHVELHLDPGPYQPRQSKPRTARLLKEFAARVGDPNKGGAARTDGLVTAYRQDAMRIAAFLLDNGKSKGSDVAKALDIARATTIMRDDHYGWFERSETRGVYQLTPRGVDENPPE